MEAFPLGCLSKTETPAYTAQALGAVATTSPRRPHRLCRHRQRVNALSRIRFATGANTAGRITGAQTVITPTLAVLAAPTVVRISLPHHLRRLHHHRRRVYALSRIRFATTANTAGRITMSQTVMRTTLAVLAAPTVVRISLPHHLRRLHHHRRRVYALSRIRFATGVELKFTAGTTAGEIVLTMNTVVLKGAQIPTAIAQIWTGVNKDCSARAGFSRRRRFGSTAEAIGEGRDEVMEGQEGRGGTTARKGRVR